MDTPDQLIEVICKRLIKPSSPTPSHLKCYKISYMDQLVPNMYVPWAFFYQNPGSQTSQLLEFSLSKTLTYYYPYAGRLKNNLYVDCNDNGVRFIEARIRCPMSQILKSGNSDKQNVVFPGYPFQGSTPDEDGSLLLVQLNYFDCGGLAVGVRMSHKLADASTGCNFFNDWAAMARESTHVPSPLFNAASLFPPNELLQEPFAPPMTQNCVQRRYLFEASKISQLKDMVANSGVDNPTRVEVVAALLYRCATVAAATANMGTFRPSLLSIVANFRPMTVPPLAETSVGNFVTFFFISTIKANKLELPELVYQLRNARAKLKDEYKEKSKAREFVPTTSALAEITEAIRSNKFDLYQFSSWCRFPFYDVDFGWGKPFWVYTTNLDGIKNSFTLMDTRNGDGIEAYITLEKPNMSALEGHQELLAYASLNA